MENNSGERFGPAVEGVPVQPPDRVTLTGELVELRPVDVARDTADLFAASHDPRDPHLWDYLPVGPFENERDFEQWLETVVVTSDPLALAVIDRETGRAAGMASYMRIVPEHAVIEIGFIWFGPHMQRTRGATEAIYLLARHSFEDLHYRRLEWKCNAFNGRSRRAAERFGFTYEGIFRNHMVVKGRSRDTAWYSILDSEWPDRRRAFEAWLRPENFKPNGEQRQTLEEIRAAL